MSKKVTLSEICGGCYAKTTTLESEYDCKAAELFATQIKRPNDRAMLGKLLHDVAAWLDFFNGIPEDVNFVTLGGFQYPLSHFEIPNELADFIEPISVKWIVGSPRCKELIEREFFEAPGTDNDRLITFRSFRNLFNNKEFDGFNTTPLDQLRKKVALADVLDRVAVNGLVRLEEKPFIPLVLKEDYLADFMESTWTNATVAEVIDLYIKDLKF